MNRKELKEMFEKKMEIKYDESAEKYPSLLETCKDILDEYRISDFVNVYDVLNFLDEYNIELEKMDEKTTLMCLDDHYHLKYLINSEFCNLNIHQKFVENIEYIDLINYMNNSFYFEEIVEGIKKDKNVILDMFFMEHLSLEGLINPYH